MGIRVNGLAGNSGFGEPIMLLENFSAATRSSNSSGRIPLDVPEPSPVAPLKYAPAPLVPGTQDSPAKSSNTLLIVGGLAVVGLLVMFVLKGKNK